MLLNEEKAQLKEKDCYLVGSDTRGENVMQLDN